VTFEPIRSRRHAGRTSALALLAGAGAGLSTLLASTSALAQVWQIEPSILVQETFTDNAELNAVDKDSDFLTTVTGGIGVTGQSRRITANISAAVAYDKYIERTELDGFRPKFLGVVQAEALQDTLFFDVRGAINDRNLDRLTPEPAFERSFDGNRARAYTYSAGTRFQSDTSNWASVIAQAYIAGASFGSADVGDDSRAPRNRQTASAVAGLTSGRSNSRLQWSILGRMSEELGSGRTFSFRSGEAQLSYAVSRQTALFILGGYDDYEDPTLNSSKRSGPFALAGVRFNPSPRLTFSGSAGHRFGDVSGTAELDYDITNALSFEISYDQGIHTQQQSLTRDLTELSFEVDAGLSDPVGAPPDFRPDDLDLFDSAFKEERLRVGLIGKTQRTEIVTSLYHYKRTFDIATTDDVVVGGRADFRRALSYNLRLGVDVDYSKSLESRFDVNDHEAELRVATSATYMFSPTFDMRLSYAYRRQDLSAGYIAENSISLVLRKIF